MNKQWKQIVPLFYFISFAYYMIQKNKGISISWNILNSILYTNAKLYKIGFKMNDSCSFCSSEPETLDHLYYKNKKKKKKKIKKKNKKKKSICWNKE